MRSRGRLTISMCVGQTCLVEARGRGIPSVFTELLLVGVAGKVLGA